jgi:hypothetical protein
VADQKRVDILLAGPDRDVSLLQSALFEPFRRLSLQPQFERAAAIDPRAIAAPPFSAAAAVRVSLDLKVEGSATLYLVDGTSQRVFVRRFDLSRGLDDIAVEQIVLVTRTSVESILAGEPIGIARDQYVQSLDAQEAKVAPHASTKRPGAFWSGGAGYELSMQSAAVVGQGPDVWVVWAPERFLFSFDVGAMLPVRVTTEYFDAQLAMVSSRVLFGPRVAMGNDWGAGVRLGPGLELTHVAPQATSPPARPAESFWAHAFALRAAGSIDHRAGDFLFAASLGVDADLSEVVYVTDSAAGRQSAFTPWLVRPFVTIQIGAVAWP